MKTLRLSPPQSLTMGFMVTLFTIVGTLVLSIVTPRVVHAQSTGGSPAVAAPSAATIPAIVALPIGLGGDCSSATCADGLVCDSNVCRSMTTKERGEAVEAKAVEAAQKSAQITAGLNAAKEAVRATHEACRVDISQCGAPVEQAEGHLRELQKSGGGACGSVSSVGTTASGNSDVLAFQRNYGLVADGQVGPNTCRVALDLVKVKTGHPVAKACTALADAKTAKAAKKVASAAKSEGLTLKDIRKVVRDEIAPIRRDISALAVRVTALEHPAVANADPM